MDKRMVKRDSDKDSEERRRKTGKGLQESDIDCIAIQNLCDGVSGKITRGSRAKKNNSTESNGL